MKKEWKRVNVIVLSILFVFMFVMSVNVVSAVASFSESVTQFVTSAIDTLQKTGNPLFSVLFGTLPTSSGADLFMQVLVFLLVVLVIYAVTDLIPIFSGRHWIQTGVGIIIAIIGIRFLPIDFIKSLAYPSTALVATIYVGLPFLLFGWLLEKMVPSKMMRRAAWAIFTCIVFVLWMYNYDNTWATWIYPLFMGACILAFAFDGALQRFWHSARAERTVERYSGVERNRIIARIKDLQTALGSATTPAERQELKKQINSLRINLQSMP